MTVTVIAGACDEARLLSASLSFLDAQTRLPDATNLGRRLTLRTAIIRRTAVTWT